VARVVLAGQRGSLADQLDRHEEREIIGPRTARHSAPAAAPAAAPIGAPRTLNSSMASGDLPGNDRNTSLMGPGQSTPAPWINVIANPHFGFQVSAEGSGYTWSRNSRENQMTPWSNDPVTDRPGETLYLCDEETGVLWDDGSADPRFDHVL